jgi:hypothetical protein
LRSEPHTRNEIRQRFRAPLPYVYRWLTDFSPEDPAREKAAYQRKIVERNRRSIIFEDLITRKTGWEVIRNIVTLHPPNRWHAEVGGNGPTWILNYRLSPAETGGTEILIRWIIRRRPHVRGEVIPTKLEAQRMMQGFWKGLADSLDRDYRKEGRNPRGPRRR